MLSKPNFFLNLKESLKINFQQKKFITFPKLDFFSYLFWCFFLVSLIVQSNGWSNQNCSLFTKKIPFIKSNRPSSTIRRIKKAKCGYLWAVVRREVWGKCSKLLLWWIYFRFPLIFLVMIKWLIWLYPIEKLPFQGYPRAVTGLSPGCHVECDRNVKITVIILNKIIKKIYFITKYYLFKDSYI